MSNQDFVDLTSDSPERVERKLPPSSGDADQPFQRARFLPNSLDNNHVKPQNHVIQPRMDAEYLNSPERQYRAPNKFQNLPQNVNANPGNNSYKSLTHQIPQPQRAQHVPPAEIIPNRANGVFPFNVIGAGIDALQAHLNKSKVFQALYQKPAQEAFPG